MNVDDLKNTVMAIAGDPWARFSAFLPSLVAALVMLAVGYVVSRLLQRIGSALLARLGFDALGARVGVDRFLARGGIEMTPSRLIGHLLFWLFMLTFVLSAAETLGLHNVSRTIETFVLYLPNVIAAVVIFVVGMTIAGFVQGLIRSGAESIGVEYAQALAKLAYGALIIVAASLAVGQLQVETALLNRIIEILLLGAAAALTFALAMGTRDVARHLVAGVYIRDLYRKGTTVTVVGQTGIVEEVGPVATRLRREDGTLVHIPNGQLTEAVVEQRARNA